MEVPTYHDMSTAHLPWYVVLYRIDYQSIDAGVFDILPVQGRYISVGFGNVAQYVYAQPVTGVITLLILYQELDVRHYHSTMGSFCDISPPVGSMVWVLGEWYGILLIRA